MKDKPIITTPRDMFENEHTFHCSTCGHTYSRNTLGMRCANCFHKLVVICE